MPIRLGLLYVRLEIKCVRVWVVAMVTVFMSCVSIATVPTGAPYLGCLPLPGRVGHACNGRFACQAI